MKLSNREQCYPWLQFIEQYLRPWFQVSMSNMIFQGDCSLWIISFIVHSYLRTSGCSIFPTIDCWSHVCSHQQVPVRTPHDETSRVYAFFLIFKVRILGSTIFSRSSWHFFCNNSSVIIFFFFFLHKWWIASPCIKLLLELALSCTSKCSLWVKMTWPLKKPSNVYEGCLPEHDSKISTHFGFPLSTWLFAMIPHGR